MPPTIITTALIDTSSRHQNPIVTIYDSTNAENSLAVSTPGVSISPTVIAPYSHIISHQNPSNPFAFEATQLERLVDPKNIELLRNIGGVNGLLRGLHSDSVYGLSGDESAPFPNVRLSDILEVNIDATKSRSSDQEAVHMIEHVTTRATNVSERKVIETFAQRKNIFGTNILPEVKSKSILALMWRAMHDKILVIFLFALCPLPRSISHH